MYSRGDRPNGSDQGGPGLVSEDDDDGGGRQVLVIVHSLNKDL